MRFLRKKILKSDSLLNKILLKNRIKRHYLKDMMFNTLLKRPHSFVVILTQIIQSMFIEVMESERKS